MMRNGFVAGVAGWLSLVATASGQSAEAGNSFTLGYSAQETQSGGETMVTSTETTTSQSGYRPSYLLSDTDYSEGFDLLWPGFFSGMDGFEGFAEPLGNPLYFESPFVRSNLRLLYLWHDFDGASQIGGGQVNVVAAQARLAITDRLALIATKDGYSWLDAGILPE